MGGAATGPEQLRAAVRERADRGVDVVKVMGSGGVLTPGTNVTRCQFTADELRLAGVRLVPGADSGINAGKPHGIVPTAVVDLSAADVAADAALATATSLAASACGLGERKGRLRPGFDADLLLVDGNLYADLAALTRVHAVLVAGARI